MRLFISELIESIRIALEQLRAHKMRAGLTTLGVVIGIVAVTLMGVAINGINIGFQNSMNMLGSDIFYVEKQSWVGEDEWWQIKDRPDIKADYAEQLNTIFANTTDSTLALAVPSLQRGGNVKYEGNEVNRVWITGTTDKYVLTNTASYTEGRFFTEAEVNSSAMVCIIGFDVAKELFPGISPIGKKVRIRKATFEIIGVFARQGSFLGLFSFDNQAVVPITAMAKISSRHWGAEVRVKKQPWASMDEARDELTGAMRRVRGLMPGIEDDFAINETKSFEEELGPIKSGIAIAGIFITGLSLFVGAIGIMNITFVSVKERTREIGTRRALGARKRSILMQFLVEAVSVCMLGGVIGLCLTLAIKFGLAYVVPNFPLEMSPFLIFIAILVAMFTGVVSGFAPALTAARLDPATALRHE
ncbi:MAG: ABC transporter permease [Verrucomicrobiota bacterium]|nr:ABC transporter permease [Verrucomicrobiota bacterium]